MTMPHVTRPYEGHNQHNCRATIRPDVRSVGSLCGDGFRERLPPVPGSADDRQVHPALVRFHTRRMDDGVAVFPVDAIGRIRLRSFHRQPSDMASAGHSSRNLAWPGNGRPADYPGRGVEADGRRRPDRSHPPHSWPLCRAPVSPAVGNGSTVAEMVCRIASGPVAVPPVRAFECGFTSSAAFIPVSCRTVRSTPDTNRVLVAGICRVCCPLWSLCMEDFPSRNPDGSGAGGI